MNDRPVIGIAPDGSVVVAPDEPEPDSIIDRAANAVAEYQDLSLEGSRRLVRIALRAIREPSEGMKAAGSRNGGWSDWYDTDDETEEQARGVWQAMIDAALEEG